MEDYKILIYLVLSVLYFLFKGRGKKKKPVTRTNTQSAEAQTDSEKRSPKSFEELLAELSGERYEDGQGSGRADESELVTKNIEMNALEDEAEERPLDQELSREQYENADDTLKELYRKGEKLKSIDELVDIDEVSTTSDRFSSFDDRGEDNHFAKEIREDLTDPDGAKKAIIYAEIFNRKY